MSGIRKNPVAGKAEAVLQDYLLAKEEARNSGTPTAVTLRKWERRFHLKSGQLTNYLANRPRRKTPIPDPEY